jgi:predicted transcriptional regulator
MNLAQIQKILGAEVHSGVDNLDREVLYGFGSDLMSDVLAFVDTDTVLLTGLNNAQVVRTAEMSDIHAIIFVRGKKPAKEVLDLAIKKDIVLMSTTEILYTACGKLFENGLLGAQRHAMGE